VLLPHVRGSTHVYDSRNTQHISRVARCRALQHSALQVWMLRHVPILHRRVHIARAAERTHIDASTEVADADVAPIRKFSRRKYIPNDGDRDSPIDLAWETRIHERLRHAGADGCATWKDASSHAPWGCRWKHCCPRGGETR